MAVIDEYIIFFSIDSKPTNEKFYEVGFPINKSLENNINNETELIYCLDYELLSRLIEVFFDKAAIVYSQTLFQQCDLIYSKLGLGKSMPRNMKEEILTNITRDEEISFGDKYTQQHKAKLYKNL